MRSNIKAYAAFVLVFILTFGLLITFTKKKPSGEKAPNFKLKTFKGKTIELSKLNDKPVVINFWASWCPPCREEAKELESFWQDYKDKVYFIGVNYKDKKDDALNFIKKYGITFENGPDNSNIAIDYKITGVPETFIIKDGIIVEHLRGATTATDLSKMIDNL